MGDESISEVFGHSKVVGRSKMLGRRTAVWPQQGAKLRIFVNGKVPLDHATSFVAINDHFLPTFPSLYPWIVPLISTLIA